MAYTFSGGDVALDLIGTVQARRTEARDLLDTPASLASWTVAAGLVDTLPAVDEQGLADTIELRETMYRLALARETPPGYADPDREALNRLAAGEPVRVALTSDGLVERTGDLAAVLAEIARSAVTLFGGPDADRIRECEAPLCTRLYVDTSRRGSRRWCDMRRCGNRAKAAAFRARHRDEPEPADA
ncbi:CGNR zinc finger domain-containing protein [Embleya scabrispora]|uniref:CGNR zinc finger domain-containing protein n=1 Tax=Embleya scabrispora TaxID=159449 RepID=UPI001F17173F|nr:ABATE domain-containing protein [Embleya scabrispora]